MNTTILSDEPLIRFADNFLSAELCKKIIEISETKVVQGKVIGSNASNTIDKSYRGSSVSDMNSSSGFEGIKELIADKVSKFTGYNSSQFESITIHKYNIGEEFKLHQDYFIEYEDSEAQKIHEERCKFGGNRIATVIIYLNDVKERGETWFPWMNQWVEPVQGRIAHFEYSYDDWELNIRTQHHGLPPLSGEKWILTIWIRERSLTEGSTEFKRFIDETNILKKIVDTSFTLEVGPEYDRRNLSVTLPANNNPENALIVAVTSGTDSTLLLYLIGMLNTHQIIPYNIIPITIRNEHIGMVEHEPSLRKCVSWIRQQTNNKIRNLQIIDSFNFSNSDSTLIDSLAKMLNNKIIHNYSHFNPIMVFLGTNETPNDKDDNRFDNVKLKKIKFDNSSWVQPFFDLQKYHIIDAILQLKLEKLLEFIGPCSKNHKTMQESCYYFPCNERRWAFTKLNLESIGDKYLTFEGNNNV